MKRNLSLAAIVSTAAISGSVLLTSIAPAQAFGCPFKNKSVNTVNSDSSPSPTLISKKLDWMAKMAIVGAGIASLGGLFAASMAYKASVAAKKYTAIAEVSGEHPEVPAELNCEELLYPPTSDSSSNKDLTRVG